MDRETSVSGVFAGNDHEVGEILAQVEGVMAAVAPVGIPLTLKVTGEGMTVPAVGRRESV